MRSAQSRFALKPGMPGLPGLFNASEVEKLAVEFAKLPRVLAADPRFAKHEGMIAQNARDRAAGGCSLSPGVRIRAVQ